MENIVENTSFLQEDIPEVLRLSRITSMLSQCHILPNMDKPVSISFGMTPRERVRANNLTTYQRKGHGKEDKWES